MTDVPRRACPRRERLRRWRLVLGGGDADGTGVELRGDDAAHRRRAGGGLRRQRRHAHRGRGSGRSGGLGRSAPARGPLARRHPPYFPKPVVQVLQRDAIERLDLRQLLLEPELLESIEPDIHLVTLLVELNQLLPDETRATARQVIAAGARRSRGAPHRPHPRGGARRARPCATGRDAPARRHRLARARSTPTCATTSPSTAR